MPADPPLHSIQPSPDDPDTPRPVYRQALKERGQRLSAERFRLPMRKRPVLKSWLLFGPVAAILLVPCFWLASPLLYTPSMAYVVEAECQELPPDDKALEQWLLGQPGVYIGFVERDGKRIKAVWGNSRTSYRDDVTPDLRRQLERFGYKGVVRYTESKDYRDK